MAIYKLQPGAIRIAGSRQGSTFQKAGTNFVIKKRYVPVQKQSDLQTVSNSRFESVAQRWRTLSITDKNKWNSRSNNFPRTDSLGNPYFMSGTNMQVGSNSNSITAGLAPLDSPSNANQLPAPNIGGVGLKVIAQVLDLLITPFIVPNNRSLKRFISVPVNSGTIINSIDQLFLFDILNEGQTSLDNQFLKYQAMTGVSTANIGQIIYGGFILIDSSTGMDGLLATEAGNIL